MINKIIGSIIFVSALFAISLSLLGVEGPITIGKEFRIFLIRCSGELEDFKIAIPSIPQIPEFEPSNAFELVLNFLKNIVNGLSTLINFIIMVCNSIIKVLEFLFIILKNLIIFRDTLVSQA